MVFNYWYYMYYDCCIVIGIILFESRDLAQAPGLRAHDQRAVPGELDVHVPLYCSVVYYTIL